MNAKAEKDIESIFLKIYRKQLDRSSGLARVSEIQAKTGVTAREIYRIRKRMWARAHKDFLSKYYRKKRKEDSKKFDFRPKNQPRRKAWKKEEISKFIKSQEGGMTAKEMAKQLKCSLASIGYHRRRYNLSKTILGKKWNTREALTLMQNSEDVLERMASRGR